MVEVDASDIGVGAVLSQHSPGDEKLHPFFSRRLAPDEWNYVGNRELLAVVLALQERHWLEGAPELFTVWLDHKNLAYLHGAKRLNSRQACWALFLGRFDFVVTYRLGPRNTKPNALSHQFAASSPDHAPELILPPACIIEAATWQIEEQVREAQRSIPDPVGAPPNTLFVPEAACCKVLQWEHSSKLACHPGLARTLQPGQRFWWPSMTPDTRTYIAACPVCARGKS